MQASFFEIPPADLVKKGVGRLRYVHSLPIQGLVTAEPPVAEKDRLERKIDEVAEAHISRDR